MEANRENYTGVLPYVPCEFFKQESRHFELPCALGDPVYIVVYFRNGLPSHVKTKTCTGIHITEKVFGRRAEKASYYLVVNSDIGRAEHIPFRDIGVKVFFSEKEAKKVVSEGRKLE